MMKLHSHPTKGSIVPHIQGVWSCKERPPPGPGAAACIWLACPASAYWPDEERLALWPLAGRSG
eukprot:1778722-Rhodomonas_salina.5